MSSEEQQQQQQQQQQQPPESYIKTTTHNYVSRKASIQGAKQVEIKGRSILQPHVTVRGDLAIVRLGRYVQVDEHTLLEPPAMDITLTTTAGNTHIPMSIGSHTHIGHHCKIRAAAIGSMVYIGNHVTLGPRCIIKDNCYLENGVVLPPDTVVPPFTRIAADPHKPVLPPGLPKEFAAKALQYAPQKRTQELPPSMAVHMHQLSLDRYHAFKQMERDELIVTQ